MSVFSVDFLLTTDKKIITQSFQATSPTTTLVKATQSLPATAVPTTLAKATQVMQGVTAATSTTKVTQSLQTVVATTATPTALHASVSRSTAGLQAITPSLVRMAQSLHFPTTSAHLPSAITATLTSHTALAHVSRIISKSVMQSCGANITAGITFCCSVKAKLSCPDEICSSLS
jgi:hypothetical protein